MINVLKDRDTDRLFRAAAGVLIAMNIFMIPAAAATDSKIGDAICSTSAGNLISMGLVGLALMLTYSSLLDGYRGLKKSNSKQTGQRSQQGEEFGAAGKKLVGAVLIAGAPDVLTAIGFNLLSCVKASNFLPK